MSLKRLQWIACAALFCACAVPAMGQGRPGGGGFGGGGGNGQFGGQNGPPPSPEQIQQYMQQRQTQQLQQMQQDLDLSDTDFAVIGPMIQSIMDLQQQLQVTQFAGRISRSIQDGGAGGNAQAFLSAMMGNGAGSPLQKTLADLQAVLNDPMASPDVILSLLEAFREARSKAMADLAQAQENLRSILTQRQEATLVVDGILN